MKIVTTSRRELAILLAVMLTATAVLLGSTFYFHGHVTPHHLVELVLVWAVFLLMYPLLNRYVRRSDGAESKIHFLYDLSRSLGEAEDFDSALRLAIERVCHAAGWDYGEAWVPRADKSVLDFSPASHYHTEPLAKFWEASRGMTFAPGAGVPGRVWQTGKSIWVKDVATASPDFFLRAVAAREAGLHSAFSIPIRLGEETLAVLVFYTAQSKKNDKHFIELVEFAAEQLSRTFRRTLDEAALRESESKFRSIAESTGDGVAVADEGGTIVFANRSAHKLFAFTDGDLPGRNVKGLIAGWDDAMLRRVLDGQSTSVAEGNGVDRHGTNFPLEVSWSTWAASGKKYFAGIFRDLTARKAAEANLKFQADILSQVEDAVVVTDTEDCVIYWNKTAEELYNTRLVTVLGRPIREVLKGPWIDPDLGAVVRAAIDEKGFWLGEISSRREDGTPTVFEFYVSDLKDEGGRSIGRMSLVRDRTEHKALENLALHSEKLAAMGRMAAVVAHEFKTPLSVIYGYAEVLQKMQNLDPSMTVPLGHIKQQAMRCSDLVTNLLDFSRKDGSSPNEIFRLQDAFEGVMLLINAYAMRKAVTVTKKIQNGDGRIRGQKTMLEQALINLANNAIDAMTKGGELTLREEEIQRDGKPWARIQVSDTGPGMSADHQKRCFEPFFTTKEIGKGTGLGLWLVREIIMKLGGHVECACEIGSGCTFSLYLPLVGEPLPAAVAQR